MTSVASHVSTYDLGARDGRKPRMASRWPLLSLRRAPSSRTIGHVTHLPYHDHRLSVTDSRYRDQDQDRS